MASADRKKWFSMLLAAALLFALFCGCGKPEEAASEAPQGDFRIVSSVSGEDSGYVMRGSDYTIRTGGSFTLSGVLDEGCVIIDAGEEKVELVLDNAVIRNSTDAPVQALSADRLTLTAAENTVNEIADLRKARPDDASGDAAGAVYAKCDLSLEGSGKLTISASYNNGIHTTKDLRISGPALSVSAPNNALKGNDSVEIRSGSVTLESGGNGIKTEHSDISGKGNQRGTIRLEGGVTDITASGDGLDAAYNVEIMEEAELTVRASGKGIIADHELFVTGGTVTVESTDDALHANGGKALENGQTGLGNVLISGGSLTLKTGDDAVHGDNEVVITGGSIDIISCREGVEGNKVMFSGGKTRISAQDDGVNACAGAVTPQILVSGGELDIETASGDTDGIDANGFYAQTGGFVLIRGGAAMGGVAGSLDTEGAVSVTGGTAVALGGICALPSGEGCCTVVMNGERFQPGAYKIQDSTGKSLIEFTLDSSCQNGWISSEFFTLGESYALYRDGDEVYRWTQTSRTEGSTGGWGMPGGPGGRPGEPPEGSPEGRPEAPPEGGQGGSGGMPGIPGEEPPEPPEGGPGMPGGNRRP